MVRKALCPQSDGREVDVKLTNIHTHAHTHTVLQKLVALGCILISLTLQSSCSRPTEYIWFKEDLRGFPWVWFSPFLQRQRWLAHLRFKLMTPGLKCRHASRPGCPLSLDISSCCLTLSIFMETIILLFLCHNSSTVLLFYFLLVLLSNIPCQRTENMVESN